MRGIAVFKIKRKSVEINLEAFISGDFNATTIRRIRKSIGKSKQKFRAEYTDDEIEDPNELPEPMEVQNRPIQRYHKKFSHTASIHVAISKLMSRTITIGFTDQVLPVRCSYVYVVIGLSFEDLLNFERDCTIGFGQSNLKKQTAPGYVFTINLSQESEVGIGDPTSQLLIDSLFETNDDNKPAAYMAIAVWDDTARVSFPLMQHSTSASTLELRRLEVPNAPRSAHPPIDYVDFLKQIRRTRQSSRGRKRLEKYLMKALFDWVRLA